MAVGRFSGSAIVATLALVISLAALVLVFFQPMDSVDWRHEASRNRQDRLSGLAFRNQVLGGQPFQAMFGEHTDLVADVAEQVAPSVVNIDVAQTRVIRYPGGPLSPFEDELMRRFFGWELPAPGSRELEVITGNGSGVVIDEEGHILTNNHVVLNAEKITVTLDDGRQIPARVVGRDQFSDLAVLKVDTPDLIPARLGDSSRLRPGEWVLAIGSPLGFDHTVTLGIVSAISRRIPDINTNVDFIQTDAAINPGNSGGPLVNLKGEVVGINTAISGRAQNIGFAIPVNTAREVARALIEEGRVERPSIGIAMIELTPQLARHIGLSETTEGVVVAQVMPGSPADRAGFREGDVIRKVDGQAITEARTIQEMVRSRPINSTFRFEVLRNGDTRTVTARSEQMPVEAG